MFILCNNYKQFLKSWTSNITTLVLFIWYRWTYHASEADQKLCSTGALHPTFKHIHLWRLNICCDKCAYSSSHAVDQFTDASLSVSDMNSYESSMQSLYPPAWNCLPRFSTDKVTGKRRCFGTMLHTHPVIYPFFRVARAVFFMFFVFDWCLSLTLFTQTNIMLQFLYGCTKKIK